MSLIEFKIWHNIEKKWLSDKVSPYNSLATIYPEDHLTFCQFTNQLDELSQKVHVGDILKSTIDHHYFYWLVSFTDQGFMIQNIGIDGLLTDKFPLKKNQFIRRQKVGNVFENPNLLKGERINEPYEIYDSTNNKISNI